MGQNRTFATLQAGRGIAAVMVVLTHLGAYVGIVPGLWEKGSVNAWLAPGAYGVDFFFILSGIVILLAHWEDLGTSRSLGSYVWKRFRRVYPIYWAFLLIAVIKQQSVTNQFAAEQRNPYVILSGVLLVHIHSLGINLAPAWTLFHEVLFYLAFGFVILNKKLGMLLCAVWFGASFWFFTATAVSNLPQTYLEMLFSPLHLLFAMGLLVGWIFKHRTVPTHLGLIALGIGLWVAALLLARQDALRSEAPWIRIVAGAGMAVAILTAMERERSRSMRVSRIFLVLGDASYTIYLSHFIVVSTLARLCFGLDRRWHLPLALWMAVIFLSAIGVGILAHFAIEVPLLRAMGRRGRARMNAALEPTGPEVRLHS